MRNSIEDIILEKIAIVHGIKHIAVFKKIWKEGDIDGIIVLTGMKKASIGMCCNVSTPTINRVLKQMNDHNILQALPRPSYRQNPEYREALLQYVDYYDSFSLRFSREGRLEQIVMYGGN